MASYIAVEDIEDGMTLNEPVTNQFGNVLLPARATLKSNHKKLLKTWNVKTLSIQDEASEEISELSAGQLERAKEYIGSRMNWQPSNQFDRDLVDSAITYMAKKKFK